jgi:hypothetical protein
MAAAVDAAEERKALDAKITEVEKELTGATGDEKVALQQRLAALEQQKLLLMQQQSGATGLGTQPECWPPRSQPSTSCTYVLQIASLPSKVSAEQVCKMMQ